jgi:hypothetical protein
MANHFAVQFNADGSESSKTLNEAMAEAPESAPVAEYREGGVVHRLQMSDDGSVASESVTRRVPAAPAVESSDPLENATLNGSRVPRARLTEDAMIEHPRLGGNMKLGQAVDFGWIKKNAAGEYAWAGEMSDLGNAPAPSEAEKADGEVVIPADAGTSTTTDLTKRMLVKDAGPMVSNGLTQAVITGKDTTSFISEISRRTGQPEAEIKQAVDTVTADYTRAAKKIATANGLRDSDSAWAGFVAWASEHQADAATNAFTAFADGHEAGPLVRLVKQYNRSGQAESAYSDAEILSANFGSDIRAVKTANGVELDIPNHGRMTLKAAMARGIVRVSK